jgi:hypothetical protein
LLFVLLPSRQLTRNTPKVRLQLQRPHQQQQQQQSVLYLSDAEARQQSQQQQPAGAQLQPQQQQQQQHQQQQQGVQQQQLQAQGAAAISVRPVATTPKTAADSSVMFGMIGRNVAGELPYVLANIAALAVHFRSAHVLLVENDSTDDTQRVFNKWAASFTLDNSGNRTAKLLGFKPSSSGHKNLRVLAEARNQYLEQLARPEYAAVDFLIAVDTDMCFPWDVASMVKIVDGLLPSVGRDWHVLYANGACGWYKDLYGSAKEEVPANTPGKRQIVLGRDVGQLLLS